MVASGSLSDPQVRQWLNGLEPAWTMLGFDSFNALHEEPSATNRAIRLEANLNKSDLSGSTVARTARMLLERASETGGLKLTATGNLARGVDHPLVAKNLQAAGLVTVTITGRSEARASRFHSAATALCHRAAASARKVLSVDREMRWR